ncbi:DUF3293 domain-containing protein [Shewanella psychropiezotolerans]|uniref:DUF3293 domain-containing protein n=1 Tax=Shewanella psychropiezotolerans TaxID=2593655 RepID=A0ABX5X715_9GAMM|nr:MULTISPECIES: DUF3293 domain-containing protein [Shewanella]MPY23642.1 DUF3293 domain-containing protein [Shewanella sp. YLB-07]QDO85693.1 DUF3293 domain-containing protein [Shewanella psychropiezotolerans]
MIESNKRLWQYYQETEFLFTQTLSSQLSFAIITAHNPKGQILTSCQNRLLDRQLLLAIEKFNRPYRAVVGASRDRTHMEKSWAVAIDKLSAAHLGLKFKQNAIYFVDNNQLALVPCLFSQTEHQKELIIGDFSKRVSLVSELPDLDY